MATIRKLRGRLQAQVRRRGMKPRCKSFDTNLEAEKWVRGLEAQVDRFGAAPDTKILESTTLGQLLERYEREVSPLKCGAVQEIQWIDVLRRHDLAHLTSSRSGSTLPVERRTYYAAGSRGSRSKLLRRAAANQRISI